MRTTSRETPGDVLSLSVTIAKEEGIVALDPVQDPESRE
jgi:hypothetical protein